MKVILPPIEPNYDFHRFASFEIDKIPSIILTIENDISNLIKIKNEKIQMQKNIISRINKAAERIAQNSIYGTANYIHFKNELNIVTILQKDIWLLKLTRL